MTLTVTFDLHLENFNSAHNFLTIRNRAFIFGMCVPYDKDLSDGIINFDYMTLIVTFDLHLENFNCAHNFLTITHRDFIFDMYDPYGKTFLMVS